MLEDTLAFLSAYPAGMIKEMTDGYRRLGVSSSIREGEWDDSTNYTPWGGYVTGHIRIGSNSLVITLYWSIALGHEIGHAIDYYLGRLAGRSTVSSALANFNDGAKYGEFADVSDVFSSGYGATSSAEDFAEIVDHLFFYQKDVKEYIRNNPDTPLTKKYLYVVDLIVGGFKSLDSRESAFPEIFAIDVFLDGNPLTFDVPAKMINGRTMVPLRAIFEAMGATVKWNNDTQTVTATRGDTVVIMTIGDTSPTVNGRVVNIDQPGVVQNGRTLAPLRFVAEAFGGTVAWDGAARTARIAS